MNKYSLAILAVKSFTEASKTIVSKNMSELVDRQVSSLNLNLVKNPQSLTL